MLLNPITLQVCSTSKESNIYRRNAFLVLKREVLSNSADRTNTRTPCLLIAIDKLASDVMLTFFCVYYSYVVKRNLYSYKDDMFYHMTYVLVHLPELLQTWNAIYYTSSFAAIWVIGLRPIMVLPQNFSSIGLSVSQIDDIV